LLLSETRCASTLQALHTLAAWQPDAGIDLAVLALEPGLAPVLGEDLRAWMLGQRPT
jgi:hypothetical protein